MYRIFINIKLLPASVSVFLITAHSLWGKESSEEIRLLSDWKFGESFRRICMFGNFAMAGFYATLGYLFIVRSDFYKVIVEQDFNQETVGKFHFVPFIAGAHAFCIGKCISHTEN